MFRNLEGARLGLFVFLGTVLIVLSIFLIGNRDSLFVTSIAINSRFESVEGLKTGAPVRLSGYTIGSVNSISLADDTTGNVIVKMRIDENVKHFIRLDSEASIESEGLVGKKVIAITAGSTDKAIVSEGTFIKSKAPINISEIIEETQAIMAYIKDITKDFSEIVEKVNKGSGSIGKLVNDSELYTSTVKITQTADSSLKQITRSLDKAANLLVEMTDGANNIFSEIDTAVISIKEVIAKVERGEGAIGGLLTDPAAYDSIKAMINNLTSTTEAAMKGTEAFAENMEALKHNWLFKGYFEQRGYWSTTDYENELDKKIEELNKQNEMLEEKLSELKKLGVDIDSIKK